MCNDESPRVLNYECIFLCVFACVQVDAELSAIADSCEANLQV